jgi:hypothetical protein
VTLAAPNEPLNWVDILEEAIPLWRAIDPGWDTPPNIPTYGAEQTFEKESALGSLGKFRILFGGAMVGLD